MALISAATINLDSYDVEAVGQRSEAAKDCAAFLASSEDVSLVLVVGSSPQKAASYIGSLKTARTEQKADGLFGISRVGRKTSTTKTISRKGKNGKGKTEFTREFTRWETVDYIMLNKVDTADDSDDSNDA
jgi:hypothetical protein